MGKTRRRRHRSWLDTLIYSANSKVFWVIFLALISFSFAFPQLFTVLSSGQGEQTVATIFGEGITRTQLVDLGRERQAVSGMLSRTGYGQLELPHITGGLRIASTSEDAYIFLQEAKRLGLRVTDAELGEARRKLWRQLRAAELALDEVLASEDAANPQNQMWQMVTKQREQAEKLATHNVFNPGDWTSKIRNLTGYHPLAFEEALRDVLLLGKLEAYVRSSVTVSDEDVYDHFVDRFHKRRLSWLPLEPAGDLAEKVEATLTEDDLRSYHRAHRQDFFKDLAIGMDYLIVPREPFEEKVAALVTEEEVLAEYERTRGDYVKPGPRTDTSFTLRTKEEMEEAEKEATLPFEEVRDEVREKLIEARADKELRELAERIEQRLQPAAADWGAITREFASENESLVAGSVEPVSRKEAEEALGDAWAPQISAWYASAEKDFDLTEAQKIALKSAFVLPEGKGFVFFRNVRVEDARDPEFEEIRGKIAGALRKEKVLELLTRAAEEKIAELEADPAGLEGDPAELADLEGKEIEIEVGDATGAASFGELGSTPRHIGRFDTIRAASSEPEAESDAADAEEDAEEPPVHPASSQIRDAGFSISEPGGLAVATVAEEDAVYIVRYDNRLKPDPAEFADRRAGLASQLTSEKQQSYIEEWSLEVRRRAYGSDQLPGEPEEEPEEVASAPAG